MTERIKNQTDEFRDKSIARLLIKYSVPATIGSLVFALYNIVDRIFIGRVVGTDALAGVSLTFPVFCLFIGIGMLIGVGGGTLTSIRLGERRYEEAENILGNVITSFIISGVILSLVFFSFLEPFLIAAGASPATLPYASKYLWIIIWIIPFDFIAMGSNPMLRAEGNPNFSMIALSVGAVLNVVLDAIFIIGFGWGVEGAALATTISKFSCSLWMLYHFIYSPRRVLTLHRRNLRVRWDIIKPMLKVGSSPCCMQIVSGLVVIFMNRKLFEYGGDLAVGVLGAVFGVSMLMLMPILGIMKGAGPIIGYNHGASLSCRVLKTLNLSIFLSVLIMILETVAVQIWPAEIISLFAKDSPEFIVSGTLAIQIYLICRPFLAFQLVVANFYTSVGRPWTSIAINLLREGVVLFSLIQILPYYFGLNGIWLAFPCADATIALFSWILLKRTLGSYHLDDMRSEVEN